MSLSYWEIRSWLSEVDFAIVGSGITGLSCALELQKHRPEARILILERGTMPSGASTKNAGFACFGSPTEILDDLRSHSEEEVRELVSMRFKGIHILRERLGDRTLDFQQLGGFELFQQDQGEVFNRTAEALPEINRLLRPIFGRDPFEITSATFGMQGIHPRLFCNPMEGQLDPGKMMRALALKVSNPSTAILNGVEVLEFEDLGDSVQVHTPDFDFRCGKLLLATNGFAGQSTGLEVSPARAQVLVTEPVPGHRISGSFHLEAGYYYFRNIGDRILLGGGRNLDKEGETTTEFGLTPRIQERLEGLLREVILPGTKVRIEKRWSGIMGTGPQKKPILKRLSNHVSCGVRLGGMGVAIGSHTGSELAALALSGN